MKVGDLVRVRGIRRKRFKVTAIRETVPDHFVVNAVDPDTGGLRTFYQEDCHVDRKATATRG